MSEGDESDSGTWKPLSEEERKAEEERRSKWAESERIRTRPLRIKIALAEIGLVAFFVFFIGLDYYLWTTQGSSLPTVQLQIPAWLSALLIGTASILVGETLLSFLLGRKERQELREALDHLNQTQDRLADAIAELTESSSLMAKSLKNEKAKK
ncbi:MAG: hypothetical protein JRM99_03235 [Nitrososphaerota archaeon]|nr:hypothetical protein [Nitrososphaerota archaeon]